MDPFTDQPSGKPKMRVRQSEDFITARFPNPKTGQLSPSNVSILAQHIHHTPRTLEDPQSPSAIPKPLSPNGNDFQDPKKASWRSNSKDWWMEIKSTPAATKTTPRSRKTSSAIILTDGNDKEPAFESDAFAVLMPTTREPIEPVTPAPRPKCEFRAKLPSPSPAQVAAYHHYAEKTRRNASQECKKEHVPNRITSFDYAYADAQNAPEVVMQPITPPISPPSDSPGTFPTSPPIGPPVPPPHVHYPRSIIATPVATPRKPVTEDRHTPEVNHSPPNDTSGGAENSRPPSPSKPKEKIKIRVKARATKNEPEKLQKESWWSLYTRSTPNAQGAPTQTSAASSSSVRTTSRTPSPAKTRAITPVPYTLKETPGGWHTAPVAPSTPEPTKPRPKGLGFTLPWLKSTPAGPRPQTPTPASAATPAYTSPFTTTLTPTPVRIPTPLAVARKVTKAPSSVIPTSSSPATRAQTFENGFEQVKRAMILLLKLCFVVYVAVGVWYVLDAVREAVWVVTWPVRAVGGVFGVLWACVWEALWFGLELCRRCGVWMRH